MNDVLNLKAHLHPQFGQAFERYALLLASQAPARVGIFLEDRFEFAGALFAALQAGCEVVLPADVLPQTVAAVAPLVDVWIGPVLVSPASQRSSAIDKPRVIIFTSGSTGTPIPVPKSLAQLEREIETLEHLFGAELAGSSFYSSVSHQHIYGLLFSVLWPALVGHALTQHNLRFPEQFEKSLQPTPSVLVSSPAILKRLSHCDRLSAPVKAVFSSGGPLSRAAAQQCELMLGVTPVEIYGSTETGGIAYRKNSAQPWRPFPNMQTRVSASGHLEVQGPHLPDSEWVTTADLARIEGTSFTLLGRSDRIAKIEEKRVSLGTVELAALRSDLVTAVRALEVEHQGRGSLGLVAALSPRALSLSRQEIARELKAKMAESVEPVAVPKWVRLVAKMPVNAQGKTTDGLLNPLFDLEWPRIEIVKQDKTFAELKVFVTSNLRVLHGHFSGIPVVPGVAQVDWAIHFARLVFSDLSANCRRLDVIKFQMLLRPPREPTLFLELNPLTKCVTFKLRFEDHRFSSGKLVFS
jgi:acyl-CoA synthetase (AMP-forming)/AMP-acid ligase II/3-hydroxymyristoyl/3-hydroxydecanoyl-(acyl carrier protein) dehydratase